MSLTREQLVAELLKLSDEEREHLFEETWLMKSRLSQEDIDKSWADEAARREAALDAGEITAAPEEEALAHIYARFRK